MIWREETATSTGMDMNLQVGNLDSDAELTITPSLVPFNLYLSINLNYSDLRNLARMFADASAAFEEGQNSP